MSQQQLVNCFLNLNQLFTTLYQLKFKGRKILEELINTLYQLQLLQKQPQKLKQKLIFEAAIANCLQALGKILNDFEQNILQRYTACIEKVNLNSIYLEKASSKRSAISPPNPYELLLLQLIQVGLDLSQAYRNQQTMIREQWSKISSQVLASGKEPQGLKELMLHIGFETYIEEHIQETWRIKLAALSNQRYNPKKI